MILDWCIWYLRTNLYRRAYTDPYFTGLMEEAYKEWHQLEEQTGVKLVKYDLHDDYDYNCFDDVCNRETGLLCFSDMLESPWLGAIIDSLVAQVKLKSNLLQPSSHYLFS